MTMIAGIHLKVIGFLFEFVEVSAYNESRRLLSAFANTYTRTPPKNVTLNRPAKQR
jgi:hypothetical protein